MTDPQGRSRAPLGGSCRPSTESGDRSIAAMPVGAIRASGLPAGHPDLSAVLLDSTVSARTSARQARPSTKALGRSRGGFNPQIHILTDPTGPSPAPARDERPAPRQHSGPNLGGSLDGRAAVLPDRRPGLRRRRLPRVAAQRGIEAFISARNGRTNPSPTPDGTQRATP